MTLEEQHKAALSIVEAFPHKEWAASFADMILHLPDTWEWTEENIEAGCRSHVEISGLSFEEIEPFLIAALTGATESLPIFIVMQSLGAQTCNMRICNPRNWAEYRLITGKSEPLIVAGGATMKGTSSF